jgi:ABC-type branched-subunit amino acid transport system substrate-binding protein
MRPLRGRIGPLLLAAGLALAGAAAGSAELGEREQAGRQIYLKGVSPSGARITALIGMSGLELSGDAIACGNCHGEDGRGRAEGGIVPPSIEWSELVKPYGHDHDGRRRHGPFDERSLQRTLMQGFDPEGNRLDGAMPRYSMSAYDFGSLVAYLKKLESDLDPGLGAQALRIGTLLPADGRMGDLGKAVRELLAAYFETLNARGGIHGRKLELVVEPLPDDMAQAPERARALLAERNVFAVLAPVSAGVEKGLADAARATQVPVIGPLTLFPEQAQASNPYVFHLLPGVTEMARLLARHAARDLKLADRPIALWHADHAEGRARAHELEASLHESGWHKVITLPLPAHGASHDALAATLKSRAVAGVLVLAPGAEFGALAAALARIDWALQLLVPGPLASRDLLALPPLFRDHVTLAYPTAPGNQQESALRDLAQLLQGRADARAHQPSLVSAYGAALLLVEGLKRTGRDLSRRKLLATLETVQSFDTGLMPRLSYNPDRRIGAPGGYLVAVDLEGKGLRPIGGYQLP